MLLTIVDTKSYGKFVLHLHPYRPLDLPKDDVTPLQLTQSLTQAFEYFGIYKKSDVISTSTGQLKQGTVVDLLEANQKYTQLLLGIDQNCVLISKSCFLDSSKQFFHNIQYQTHNIQLGQFISLNDTQSSIVNSISIVYRQQSFNNIDIIKHKLAYLVSALQLKQKHSKYLSKQIVTIVEQKNQFKRVLKQKCTNYLKQNNAIYEEFKIKMIYKEIQSQASAIIKKIHIFQLLERIHNNWDKKQFFKPQLLDDQILPCLTSINLQIPSISESKQNIKNIQNKTIITIPPKLNSLPSILYPQQRIQYIYQRLLSNNAKPLKNIISSQLQIGSQSIYHTVYFLMRNELAQSVFPFDSQKFYTLYTLRTMPDKKIIQKFNSLFNNNSEGQDILEYLKKFQKYHRVKYLDQKVKYLILNKIIKEVAIYIEKLQPVNSSRHNTLSIWTSGLHSKDRKPSFEVNQKQKSTSKDYIMMKKPLNEDKKQIKDKTINNPNKSTIQTSKTNSNQLNLPYQSYIPPFIQTQSTIRQKQVIGSHLRNTQMNKKNQNGHQIHSHNANANSAVVESILNTYVTKPEQINFILGKCRDKGIKMTELINFVKNNSSYWKFIFVENKE